jgi:hypothetical protein
MPRLPRLRKGAEKAPQAPATPEPPAPPPPAPEAATTVIPAVGEHGEIKPPEQAPVAPTATTGEGAATTPGGADAGAQATTPVEAVTDDTAAQPAAPADAAPGFRDRARIRRRLRHLRRYRELAFRDLGGLVFDLQRFGRDRPDLVTQKLDALGEVDRELRALETALREKRDVTELREAGIAACPRCGTLHGTDANFCPGCGTALRGSVVRDAAPVTVAPADPPQPAEQPQQPTTP